MMFRKSFLYSLLLIFAALLQATLFTYLSILDTKPDLVLILLVFISLYQGCNVSQISGFISGLVEDCISLAPLGFHAFVRALMGFLVGLFKDKISVNTVVFPLVIIPVVTLCKYCVSFLLSFIFTTGADLRSFFSIKLPVEIGYNVAIGLVVYLILRLFVLSTDNANQRYKSDYDK